MQWLACELYRLHWLSYCWNADGDVEKRPTSLVALTRLHGMFGEPLVTRPPVIQDDPIVSCLLCGVPWGGVVALRYGLDDAVG